MLIIIMEHDINVDLSQSGSLSKHLIFNCYYYQRHERQSYSIKREILKEQRRRQEKKNNQQTVRVTAKANI